MKNQARGEVKVVYFQVHKTKDICWWGGETIKLKNAITSIGHFFLGKRGGRKVRNNLKVHCKPREEKRILKNSG